MHAPYGSKMVVVRQPRFPKLKFLLHMLYITTRNNLRVLSDEMVQDDFK